MVLALDLGVINRKAHVVSVKEALVFTSVVFLMAVLFNVFVYYAYDNHWLGLGQSVDRVDGAINDGRLAAVKFFTGYIIEVSLSADNVFVIAMIFEHLRVPAKYQHRVIGEMGQPGLAFQFSDTPTRVQSAPMMVGEHTREILASLGYSESEAAGLFEAGIVGDETVNPTLAKAGTQPIASPWEKK